MGTLLLCFIYFLPRPGDWNQDARVDTGLAVVNHATLRIDPYYWNSRGDTLRFEGHYYANKAPGLGLLTVPFVGAYKSLMVLTGNEQMAERIGVKKYFKSLYGQYYLLQCVSSIFIVSIPSALFMLLFFWFLGYFVTSQAIRLLLTLSTGLATIVFPWAQILYPHMPTAGLLFTAFVLLYAVRLPASDRSARGAWIARNPARAALLTGVCLGGAVIIDHTAVIPGFFLCLYAVTRLSVRNLIPMALGGLPFVLAILAYDYAVFHNPTITGYNWSGGGVGGSDASGVPEGNAVWGMSFSPYRGLFFVSPFLVLSVPGFYLWAKRGGWEWLLFAAISVSYYFFICTIYYWPGGVSVGPRYLVPVIFFIAVPVVFVLERARSWRLRALIGFLIALSVLNIWIQTIAAKGYPDFYVINPLFDHAIPAVTHGNVALSLGTAFVAAFVGINSLWSLVPLAVFLALWTLYCTRRIRGETRVPAVAVSHRSEEPTLTG